MKLKTIALLLIAAMLFATMPAFALYNVEITPYIEYDEFTNYAYSATNTSNDGISSWRIEGGNNGNASSYVVKSTSSDDTTTGMSTSLKLADSSAWNQGSDYNNSIRGGRFFKDGKIIGAGETINIEFDIYTDSGTQFDLGVSPTGNSNAIEDRFAGIPFSIQPDGTIKRNGGQWGYIEGNAGSYSTVTYKHGEKNHIKLQYVMNPDNSAGTSDTVYLTVTNNTAGTTTGTATVGYRKVVANQAYSNYATYGIRGISFFKRKPAGNVYIDNFKAYTAIDYSTPEVESVKFTDGVDEYTASDDIPANITDILVNFDSDIASADDAAKIVFGSNKTLDYTGEMVGMRQYKLTLANQLISGLTYTLGIDASKVQGVSGNYMPRDYSIAFTPTVAATDTEVVGGTLYDYKIRDTFEDYEYKVSDSGMVENNGKDFWRIESATNANCSDYVSVEDLTVGEETMTDALKLADTSAWGQSNNALRGGKFFTSTVGAGEKLYIDFDIYTDDTSFTLGLIPGDMPGDIEDQLRATVFGIFDSQTSGRNPGVVYRGYDQRNYASSAYGGALEYKPEEINHIRIEYSMNADVSANTKDTAIITITNSAGETSVTNTLNFRSNIRDAGGYLLSSIKGIAFTKGQNGDLLIDNLKIYTTYDYKTPEITEVSVYDKDGNIAESDILPPSIKPVKVTPNIKRAEIKFNTPMRHAEEFIDMLDGDGYRVDYWAEYGAQNLSVILHFDDLLKPDTTYRLVVDSGAIAKSGLESADSRELEFTTEADGSVVVEATGITDAGGNPINLEEAEGAVTLKSTVTLMKTETAAKKYILVMAVYDSEGKMTDMNMEPITLVAGAYGTSQHTITLTVAQIENVENIKAVLCSFPGSSCMTVDVLSK